MSVDFLTGSFDEHAALVADSINYTLILMHKLLFFFQLTFLLLISENNLRINLKRNDYNILKT